MLNLQGAPWNWSHSSHASINPAGKSEEVFVCNVHTDKALVLLGDGALLPDDQREGDQASGQKKK